MHSLFVRICQKIIGEYQDFTADEFIDETFDCRQYGLDAKIIHIPGHTNGSIGILTTEGNFICGDIFANTKKPGLAPNAFDFAVLKTSVKKLQSEKIEQVFPGHGEPFAYAQLARIR